MLQVPTLKAQGYVPITPFRITGTRGYLQFGAELDDESRENSRDSTVVDRQESVTIGELHVGFDAYIYHPRFLDFSADIGKGYEKNRYYTGRELAGEGGSDIDEYGLLMRLLKGHPLSFWFGKSRQRQVMDSPFLQRVPLTNRRDQAGLSYNSKLFHLRSGFNALSSEGDEIRIRGAQGERIQSPARDEREELFYVDLSNSGKLGNNFLRFEDKERIEKVGGTGSENVLKVMSRKVDFSNQFSFGREEKHNLSSRFNLLDQKGFRPLRFARMDEYLSIRNTKNLRTYYGYVYTDNKYEDQDIVRYQYKGGLTHQLYQSLQTTCEVVNEKLRIDSGTEDRLYGKVHFNYNKKTPFGKLLLNYGFDARNEDENFSGVPTQITQERHTFGENPESDMIILLDRDLADPDSILFVDADGLPLRDGAGFLLEEGIHYRIESIGTLTKIRLLSPEGDFLKATDVLVNYEFEPLPEIEFNTFGHKYGITLHVQEWLEAFFNTGRISQKRVDGIDLGRLENTKDKRYGTEINWKNSTTKVEKRVRRSRRNPYKTRIVSEHILFELTPVTALVLDGRYSDTVSSTDITSVSKTIDRSVSAKLQIRLPRNAKWNIMTEFGNQDQVVEKLKTRVIRSDLQWIYKSVNLLLTYENRKLKKSISGDEKRQRFFLKVRRYFGSQKRGAW